jgi:hypothetical protein
MPFHFTMPETSARPENPADMLLRTYLNGGVITMIMGETRPKYEGHVIDSVHCPTALKRPQVMPAGGEFECVPSRIVHEFGFDMVLVAAPLIAGWTSVVGNPVQIGALSKFLDRSAGKALSNAADFSHTTRVTVRPLPNWPMVREHVYSHEMQHVCDFKWAATKMFGPVVKMQDDFHAANVRVRCANQVVLEFVAGGGTECNGIAKYRDATNIMGAHYHGTPAGSGPLLTFAGVSSNGNESLIDLTQPGFTFPVSFHTGRPHQYFQVEAGGLRNVLEAVDPPVRATPALTQESVDKMMGGGADSGDESDGSGGEAFEF